MIGKSQTHRMEDENYEEANLSLSNNSSRHCLHQTPRSSDTHPRATGDGHTNDCTPDLNSASRPHTNGCTPDLNAASTSHAYCYPGT